MKSFLIFFLLIQSSSYCQNESKALKDFQKIVKTYENFFSKPNHYFAKKLNFGVNDYESNSVRLYKPIAMEYDAQKTESIITPYSGFIEIEYELQTNAAGTIDYLGWTNSEKAFLYKDSLNYYGLYNTAIKTRTDIFYFAYRDKWELISVKDKNGNSSPTAFLFGFENELDLPIEYLPAKEMNNKWLLLKP